MKRAAELELNSRQIDGVVIWFDSFLFFSVLLVCVCVCVCDFIFVPLSSSSPSSSSSSSSSHKAPITAKITMPYRNKLTQYISKLSARKRNCCPTNRPFSKETAPFLMLTFVARLSIPLLLSLFISIDLVELPSKVDKSTMLAAIYWARAMIILASNATF